MTNKIIHDVICNHHVICPQREDCGGAKPHDARDCDPCKRFSGEPYCIPHIERILCAATYYNDNLKHECQPKNITIGYVIAGRRHSNSIITGLLITPKILPTTQGFITSFDRFVDRHEAFKIAEIADQLLIKTTTRTKALISEDLY